MYTCVRVEIGVFVLTVPVKNSILWVMLFSIFNLFFFKYQLYNDKYNRACGLNFVAFNTNLQHF